jgi:hypothetical protein
MRTGQGFFIAFSLVDRYTFEEADTFLNQISRVKDEEIYNLPLVLIGYPSSLVFYESEVFSTKFSLKF